MAQGRRLCEVCPGLRNDWLHKVDVDSCDCCFVEDVLKAGIRPLLIHVEVHPLVPPPFGYRPCLSGKRGFTASHPSPSRRPVFFDPSIGDSMLSLSALACMTCGTCYACYPRLNLLAVSGVLEGRPGHMLHCSLSAFEELLDDYGYHLAALLQETLNLSLSLSSMLV